jgi:N utilization substance protein A
MTPEQLEEIPGIGPKTIEKISLAVNEYFSNLETADNAPDAEIAQELSEEAPEVIPTSPEQDPGAFVAADEASEEYKEAVATDQALEAEVIAGVENAPPADLAEVHVHGEQPEPVPEDTVLPEEEVSIVPDEDEAEEEPETK